MKKIMFSTMLASGLIPIVMNASLPNIGREAIDMMVQRWSNQAAPAFQLLGIDIKKLKNTEINAVRGTKLESMFGLDLAAKIAALHRGLKDGLTKANTKIKQLEKLFKWDVLQIFKKEREIINLYQKTLKPNLENILIGMEKQFPELKK